MAFRLEWAYDDGPWQRIGVAEDRPKGIFALRAFLAWVQMLGLPGGVGVRKITPIGGKGDGRRRKPLERVGRWVIETNDGRTAVAKVVRDEGN
jgi:hypothetical protein